MYSSTDSDYGQDEDDSSNKRACNLVFEHLCAPLPFLLFL